jgi:lipopolysaccharide export system protein LptA
MSVEISALKSKIDMSVLHQIRLFILPFCHNQALSTSKALCVFIFISIASLAVAQTPFESPQDTTKKLKIESSELGEYFVDKGVEKQKLSGHVRLNNEGTLIFCDTAIIFNDNATLLGNVIITETDTTALYGDSVTYDAVARKAVLYGNATLKDGSQQLFTDRLYYDLNTKMASYHNHALLSNGKSQLRSKHGYYYTNERQIYFKEDVVLTDPEFTLRTDTLRFDAESKIAYFLAPTLISQPESKIYTEGGYYDTANNRAEFDKNPQFTKKDQKGYAQKMLYEGLNKEFLLIGQAHIDENDKIVNADSIYYSDATGQSILRGNATFRDSTQDIASDYIKYDSKTKSYSIEGRAKVKNGTSQITADKIDFNDELGSALAQGSVIYADTASDYTILAARIDYNKKTDYSYASGGYGDLRRPLFKTLLDRDTLYMSADTLTMFKPNLEDSVRVLTAHRDVRIFKNDLQASADSMSYSSLDSTFVFYKMALQPLMWSDTTQFSADTIALQLRDGKLNQIKLQKDAFVHSSKGNLLFDQIKGRTCTAWFADNEISVMDVEGNAQAVYYALDDNKAFIGVNESKCSTMKLNFGQGRVVGIRFYKQPEGSFSPMTKSDQSNVRLEGFSVEVKRRPLSIEALMTP